MTKSSIDILSTKNISEEEITCQDYLIIKNDLTDFHQEGEGRSAFGMTDTHDARNLFLDIARSECAEPKYNYDFHTISNYKFYVKSLDTYKINEMSAKIPDN